MLAQWTGVAAAVTTLDGRVRSLRTADAEVSSAEVFALECFDRSGRFRVEDEPAGISRHAEPRGGSGDARTASTGSARDDNSTASEALNWGNVVIEGGRRPDRKSTRLNSSH